MIFKDIITAQVDYLKREKAQIVKLLSDAPEGKLIKRSSRGCAYFYERKNNEYRSLKKDETLVKAYIKKNELENALNKIDHNLSVLQPVMDKYIPCFAADSIWTDLGAEENPFHMEDKKHLCNGVYYRSKSEMFIARALILNGIEFKYEPSYKLGGRTVYPDFVIKRPKDGKIFIWEHFGRMDLEEYEEKAISKIFEYHDNGFCLWDNLLISFDKTNGSLDLDTIDKIIKIFLM